MARAGEDALQSASIAFLAGQAALAMVYPYRLPKRLQFLRAEKSMVGAAHQYTPSVRFRAERQLGGGTCRHPGTRPK